ncbi:hypothetical protein HKX48_002100, partial [Thoreauomyces humboldtii]
MILVEFLLALVLTAGAFTSPIPVVPLVKINSTVIVGHGTGVISETGTPVAEYLGIPYAPQPVRFSPAERYKLPDGNFVASNYTPICNQLFPGPGGAFEKAAFTTGAPNEDENCLSLNVWTPQKAGAKPRANAHPVMLWIYGGAYLFGGSSQPSYDGAKLASHNMVIVSFNYRTNLFGFPGAAQLPILEQNLGLLDQRLALQWVQNHISAFGGDPSRVTIVGESAGATSVESLILQGPAEPKLFRAAVQDSNVALGFSVRPIGPLFEGLAGAVGCNQTDGDAQLSCMRAVPAGNLTATAAAVNLPFGVVVDNATFFGDPYARRASGLAAKVPTIIGSDQDEGDLFTVGTTNFTAFVLKTFPGAPLSQVQSFYPIGATKKYPSDYAAASAAFRDGIFQCKARIDAAIHSLHNSRSTYRYLYQSVFANEQPVPSAGAFHSSELPLLFGNLYPDSTASEVRLSKDMGRMIAAFVKDPTTALEGWPTMTGSGSDRIAVVANDTIVSFDRQD